MKQCPQCGSIYSDDTLNFCLTDRANLVPVIDGEGEGETTVIREYPAAASTRVIRTEAGVSPVFKYLAIGLGVLLLLLTGAGLAAWSFWNSRTEQSQQTSNSATPIPGIAPSRPPANTAANSRPETPSPTKTPIPTGTPVANDVPQKDAGTGRITFNRGHVSQTVSGTILYKRSFVLRTMAGQALTARVTSRDGCVEFDGGGNSVDFETPNGDVSLDLTNTCDDPASFSMTVTVR